MGIVIEVRVGYCNGSIYVKGVRCIPRGIGDGGIE